MFLTHQQLIDLTDCKRPSDQMRWLAQNGYRFEVGASGRPKVLIAEVEARLLSVPVTDKEGKRSKPRFDLLKEVG